MIMKSVGYIFGGEAKVKMMRLFIFNPSDSFNTVEVSDRTKENPRLVRRELAELEKSGLIRRRGAGKHVVKKKRGQATAPRKAPTFTLNHDYPYLAPLSDFLVDANPLSRKEIVKRISKCGVSIKFVLLAGVFTHDPESRVDLLVVGDHLKKKQLVSTISMIEAELGKEIRYAAFETPEFKYRLSMYDKLIRDVLDFPHEKALNKLGI